MLLQLKYVLKKLKLVLKIFNLKYKKKNLKTYIFYRYNYINLYSKIDNYGNEFINNYNLKSII